MIYRRFGKTELKLPVLSCGGMRFQQSWNDREPVRGESQANVEACVRRALELGINHIETARGYGTSEAQLGQVLPKIPRDRLIVQTKIAPAAEHDKFLANAEDSLDRIGLEFVDLFAIHGVNDAERLAWTVREGGCLDAALELKRQGRVRHVGFSTHAPLDVILAALGDGRFDYVNLHWYWANQENTPALVEARRRDMGVFIISPTDKGGRLYEPSQKLSSLCDPLSPIVFNDLFCLSRPEVHTISIGAARPSDFDEHMKTLPLLETPDGSESLRRIEDKLDGALVGALGKSWMDSWSHGLPDWQRAPGQINVKEILRLYNLAKGLDMVSYGKARYNLLGNGGHWFPGNRAERAEELDWSGALASCPHRDRILEVLVEAHRMLAGREVKRLGTH